MKTMTKYLTVTIFALYSASSFANLTCPKGSTLTGGTGPDHKGGKCVVDSTPKGSKETKTTVKTTESKTKTENKIPGKP